MFRPKNSVPKPEQQAIPLAACLAKTRWTPAGLAPGRTVEEHCRIAAAVADKLLSRLFAIWPAGTDIFPENASLSALLHDIGKISPKFQKMLYEYLQMPAAWPQLAATADRTNNNAERHEAISYATLYANGASEQLAWCAGLHHGREFVAKPDGSDLYGGKIWACRRAKLLATLKGDREFPVIGTLTEQLLLTGLTIVSDWIASGDIFADPDQDWLPLVDAALDAAGFIYAKPVQGLTFRDIFGFAPNACQELAGEAICEPGVYILEAPMGSGKTEAALFGAYNLIAQGHASGIYFGLPTQLTSNKIHARVDNFLAKVLPAPTAPILAHADAWLARYQRQLMGEEVEPGGQWFEQGRRAILAPYAVGTVDQALMAALRGRWSGLRLFGLAGKVAILDEIHSYDAYTSAIIESLIGHLGGLGSTVIILSATLARSRRARLLNAADAAPAAEVSYPRLTAARPGQATQPFSVARQAGARVVVRLSEGEDEALEECLERAEAGQQVVWIENTVRTAQAVFRKIGARAAQYGIEAGLLHSRFTQSDRSAHEAYWTAILGKEGSFAEQRRADRGRILVGTQVIEQSLDIDADFMVSRFAPTDLVLQRMGRLWRHERPARPASARREIYLLAPPLADVHVTPEHAFAETGAVYSPYTLARSLEVWQDKNEILLPDDIEELVEKTYLIREEEKNSAMARAQAKENGEVKRKIGQARLNLSAISKLLDEDVLSARLVELESVKILLLQDLDLDTGRCRTLCGESLDLHAQRNGGARLQTAASLANQVIRVPVPYAPLPAAKAVQKLLQPFLHEAKSESLRVLLIDRAGAARDVNGMALSEIRYDQRLGYAHV